MTRATLVKLLLLVLLVFIICLPEFFTLNRALKVKLTCLPRGGGNGREDVCDPSQTLPDGDQESGWFRCETDTNLTDLRANIPPTDLHVQVSLELQFRDAEALNLTLWGLGNHTSLHLHPPEEEEEEEDEDRGWNVEKVGGETRAFYCCYPGPASPGSVTRGLCLLYLFNQTALRRAAHNRLLLVDKVFQSFQTYRESHKHEWRCVFRVLWLVLLCVALLIIFTSVFRRICLCKKPKIYPVVQNFTGQHLNGAPEHLEETLFWREMSTIHEVPSQEEIETLLDGNNEQSFTANLHHRCHHTASPPAADRPGERPTFH